MDNTPKEEPRYFLTLVALGILLLFCSILALSAIGIKSIVTSGDIQAELANKDAIIAVLETKVSKLKECCRWSAVMEQLLSPSAQQELDEKEKKFKPIE